MCKYIILTGGVAPDIGKSLLAVSLATLLKDHGYRVKYRRISTYLNMNTSLMDPTNSEEAFITVDGAVVDRAFSHFERFSELRASADDWISMGTIYKTVVEKESAFGYEGAAVHFAPQVAGEVKSFMQRAEDEQKYDFVLIDIKGTVGDSEVAPQLEAARLLREKLGKENSLLIHSTLIPQVLGYYGLYEYHAKPTLHSLEKLQAAALSADLLVCKYTGCAPKLDEKAKREIVNFSNFKNDEVFALPEVTIDYETLLLTHQQKIDAKVLSYFGMKAAKTLDLKKWEDVVATMKHPAKTVKIGLVGKYPIATPTAYRNLAETLQHAGVKLDAGIDLTVIDSGKTEAGDKEELAKLGQVDGFLLAGGFGPRGMEGIIQAITYARTHKVPILGICLGFQMMAVEFARSDLDMNRAHTTEFDPDTPHPTVHQIAEKLRAGLRPTKLEKGTKLASCYAANEKPETFFHRWGVNNNLIKPMRDKGMLVNCYSQEGDKQIIVGLEIADHPWFVGVQYHPEMRSTPFNPGGPYVGLVEAALKHAANRNS